MKRVYKTSLFIAVLLAVTTSLSFAADYTIRFKNNFDKTVYVSVLGSSCKIVKPPKGQPLGSSGPKQIAIFSCPSTSKKNTFTFFALLTNLCGCQYICKTYGKLTKVIPILGYSQCPVVPSCLSATCPTKPAHKSP